MRAFLKFFRGLHSWLLVNAVLLALFFSLRGEQKLMTAVSTRFSMPLEHALSAICSLVPFSVAELCYVILVAAVPVYVATGIRAFLRSEYKADVVYARIMIVVNLALSVYAAFCLFWGVNFYADDFCDRSGIYAEPVAYEDLVEVTRLFAREASVHADAVARSVWGTYAVPRQDSLNLAPALYGPAAERFPFLALRHDPVPKQVFFSRVLSAMNVTGVYFPFTGESNLNMDFPAASFPFTIAHELAHRRGVASEQQANFLGVLVSTLSDDPAYQYSGWFTGYIHLSNALYSVDPQTSNEIYASLPDTVRADLNAANCYWTHYEGAASRASGKVYDAVLRSYGDELGMKSYGAVVDLLVAYYR